VNSGESGVGVETVHEGVDDDVDGGDDAREDGRVKPGGGPVL
jgi:hypothetical protein